MDFRHVLLCLWRFLFIICTGPNSGFDEWPIWGRGNYSLGITHVCNTLVNPPLNDIFILNTKS
ncbi:MAG: hypothetical protein JWR38_2436 [Mucilaginibacter sp.]|nr:hypothetical protein [Mucilaginibacter sp.]